MNLTVQILTKDNETTIGDCLASLTPLDAEIVICDLGSSDNTSAYCENVVNLPGTNRSEIRNQLIEMSNTDWQLLIEPWECLKSGVDQIEWALTQPNNFRLYNIQGQLILKQTRLWRKSSGCKFQRPIYESLYPENDDPLLECVLSGIPPIPTGNEIKEWQKQQPHAANIEYYLAHTHLANKEYDEFIKHAHYFLFRNKQPSIASLLTHYHYALVQLQIKNNAAECINHTIYCLMQQPTMAEFWCLLGDAFVQMGQWQRASAFYDNAVILGSRRLQNDHFPIEVMKYKEYPLQMIELCREKIKEIYIR